MLAHKNHIADGVIVHQRFAEVDFCFQNVKETR